jgi:two-component system, sensor histidine kinase YesM
MTRLKKWTYKINDIPLKYKFLLIFIICVFAPIVIINIIFFDRIVNNIVSREEDNYNISINRALSDVDSAIETCISVSHFIYMDKTIYDMINTDFRNDSEFYDFYDNKLKDAIAKYSVVYDTISNMTIYTSNSSIRNGGNYQIIDNDIRSEPWYKKLCNSKNNVILCFSPNDGTYVNTSGKLSIVRRLNKYETDSSINLLKLDIDINKILNVFTREKDYLDIDLVDDSGYMMFSTLKIDSSDLSYIRNISNMQYSIDMNNSYYIIKNLGEANYLANWKIIGQKDKKRINNEIWKTKVFIITLTLICILVSSILVYLVVNSYNYRLKRLTKQIQKVKNAEFKPIDIYAGKDEIGEVINNFNSMINKINTLINDVYKLQIQKKDLEIERVRAELNFLQSQMNPHFLFNTLNAIMAVCIKNHYNDLIDVIKNLAKSFRRLLSWKDDLVTIDEEVSFTKMYLDIEKFRFGDKFDYLIDIEPELLDKKIPKMSIQPLVENACKHGIQAIKENGLLTISIKENNSNLIVSVKDNGIGITQDRLNNIMSGLLSDSTSDNVGIRNVYKRLKLYYMENADFIINSEYEKGTEASFILYKQI